MLNKTTFNVLVTKYVEIQIVIIKNLENDLS